MSLIHPYYTYFNLVEKSDFQNKYRNQNRPLSEVPHQRFQLMIFLRMVENHPHQ